METVRFAKGTGPFCFRRLAFFTLVVCNELSQPRSQLVTCTAKSGKPRFLIAKNFCRVSYAPMNPLCASRKYRTVLFRVITDCNDIVELPSRDFIDRL